MKMANPNWLSISLKEEQIFSYERPLKESKESKSFQGVPIKGQCSKVGDFTVFVKSVA